MCVVEHPLEMWLMARYERKLPIEVVDMKFPGFIYI